MFLSSSNCNRNCWQHTSPAWKLSLGKASFSISGVYVWLKETAEIQARLLANLATHSKAIFFNLQAVLYRDLVSIFTSYKLKFYFGARKWS